MTTDLVINVLTKENAEILRNKIFREDMARIVKGSYSGTYGLAISFGKWFGADYSKLVAKFLYEETENLIGMKPEELLYYEFFPNRNYEEVWFSELFPKGGIYTFDQDGIIKLEYSTGEILFCGYKYCKLGSPTLELLVESDRKDPNSKIISGLSKIYRRGFLDTYTKELWRTEFKDILVF
jgi:hypothetical protein